jgi:hypothetical protein
MLIEPLTRESIEAIIRTKGGNGWKKDAETWQRKALEQDQGKIAVLVASSAGEVRGYGSLI